MNDIQINTAMIEFVKRTNQFPTTIEIGPESKRNLTKVIGENPETLYYFIPSKENESRSLGINLTSYHGANVSVIEGQDENVIVVMNEDAGPTKLDWRVQYTFNDKGEFETGSKFLPDYHIDYQR